MSKKIKSQTVYRLSQSLLEMPDTEPNFDEAFKVKETHYNNDGTISKEAEYNPDETEAERYERDYENGKIIESRHFFETELSETNKFLYNEKGLMLQDITIYADGGELKANFEYDEQDNKIGVKTTDTDGVLEAEENWEYKNKLVLKHTKFDAEHNMSEELRLTYKNDEGDIAEEHLTIMANSIELRTVYLDNESGSITYNKDGKVYGKSKNIFDDKDRLSQLIQETYKGNYVTKYFYDENDNIIEEEKQVDGTVYFRAISSYDENNELKQRTVTEMSSGTFTDYYQYSYFE
jgi:hypothetical protein